MNFNKNDVVAIIDSGFGGVSVLKQLIKKYKSGNFIYYADNAFMPYGNKSKNQIEARINNIIKNLKQNYGANKFIIACNTASTCISESSNIYKMEFSKHKLYYATNLTKKNLINYNIIADHTLPKQIEKNLQNKSKLKEIIKHHIKEHKLNKHKEIVLGCTHYELVEDIFKELLPNTKIICNSHTIIKNIKLEQNDYLSIFLLMSKYSKSYYDKFFEIVKN